MREQDKISLGGKMISHSNIDNVISSSIIKQFQYFLTIRIYGGFVKATSKRKVRKNVLFLMDVAPNRFKAGKFRTTFYLKMLHLTF